MSFKDTPIIQRYGDGEVIVTENVVSNNAYILISGEVAISKKVGKKSVLIDTLKEGVVFGEMGLIEEAKRNATITAIGDVTVGVIDKQQFEKLLEAAPEDLRLILKAVVERLRRTTGKMSKISVEFERIKSIVDSFS